MDNYDIAPVYDQELNINHYDWQVCYCSSLSRAVNTAQKIFNGKIIESDLLREIPIKAFTKRKIKLPAFIWHFVANAHWFKNNPSQPEGKTESYQRAKKILKEIINSGHKNILIVSHGFFMRSLYRELLKLGFKGEIELNPKNGKLYTFKNSEY
ncbi:MAG: histidine phosphatase family protein [Ignavibacteria bacterium]